MAVSLEQHARKESIVNVEIDHKEIRVIFISGVYVCFIHILPPDKFATGQVFSLETEAKVIRLSGARML
jgi:hypothetical protein